MKTFERILLKIAIIQFICLLLSQILFHELQLFPQLQQITRYEGVAQNNFTQILETFKGG
jgi:hypothetical protein